MTDDKPKQSITINFGGDMRPDHRLNPVPIPYGCCPRCGYRGAMR